MPDITIKRLDQMERYSGSFQKGQQFFFAGKSLGLAKLGMNGCKMPPHWEHYSEHGHVADDEEELYIPLEGSGELFCEGQSDPIACTCLSRRRPGHPAGIVPG